MNMEVVSTISNSPWLLNIVTGVFANIVYCMISVIVLFLVVKWFKSSKSLSVCGVYDCLYVIPWKTDGGCEIREIIALVKFFSSYYGYVICSKEAGYRDVERPTRRTESSVFNGRYMLGEWNDPCDKSIVPGTFMLMTDADGKVCQGIWTGYSKTCNEVKWGTWTWSINENLKYPLWWWLLDNVCRRIPYPGIVKK